MKLFALNHYSEFDFLPARGRVAIIFADFIDLASLARPSCWELRRLIEECDVSAYIPAQKLSRAKSSAAR